jgi:nuclear GTP-binding protein
MSLIRDNHDDNTKNGIKQHKAKGVIETASYKDTFGKHAQRKKVTNLAISSFEELSAESEKKHAEHLERLEEIKLLSGAGIPAAEREDGGDEWNTGTNAKLPVESLFLKGQSKRIWVSFLHTSTDRLLTRSKNELYKVIDSSDVVIHVLDARDPLGNNDPHFLPTYQN